MSAGGQGTTKSISGSNYVPLAVATIDLPSSGNVVAYASVSPSIHRGTSSGSMYDQAACEIVLTTTALAGLAGVSHPTPHEGYVENAALSTSTYLTGSNSSYQENIATNLFVANVPAGTHVVSLNCKVATGTDTVTMSGPSLVAFGTA